MNHLIAFVTMVLLFVGVAAAKESESRPAPEQEAPAHSPEWSDHNEHDPGVAEDDESAPHKTPHTRAKPSQTKVLIAPAAVKAQRPCATDKTARLAAETTDREAGAQTFGDGEHGRIPQTRGGDCAVTSSYSSGEQNSKQAEGDPDHPVVTGRVTTSDEND